MKTEMLKFERIRNLREDRDLTQQKVADYLHVKQNTYSQYEIGVLNYPVEVLIKLAVFYDVSMDYLILDSVAPDENLFTTINSILQNKDKRKVKIFMTTIRALIDKIDEF